MAQLSPESFAADAGPLRLGEVVERLQRAVTPIPDVECVPLRDADGRVLAEDLIAGLSLPAFANSAMDGYALRHADLGPGGASLTIIDRVTAGGSAGRPIGPGEATRIFTGARLPDGADTVAMQEEAHLSGGQVRVPPGLALGANVRSPGEDIAADALALAAGRRLQPSDVALAAALGVRDLPVRRQLRVALFSTGNELADPGAPLGPSGLYDANRPLLAAMLQRAGAVVIDRGILADERSSVERALLEAAELADLVVTSGGVSMGEEDHVRAALDAIGRLEWWRVAIKPGRPIAMGVVAGTAVVGLPGNPVAAFVTAALILRPLLAALSGEAWRRPVAFPVRAGFAFTKKPGRREFLRAQIESGPDGPVALKHAQDGAAVLTSLTRSDGLVELAEDVTSVGLGEPVGFLPFSSLD